MEVVKTQPRFGNVVAIEYYSKIVIEIFFTIKIIHLPNNIDGY
jgi:hypothetical protein